MKLTKKQKAVLVGTVLGDAFLQKAGEKNARLRLEHGEKQKEYLFWKSKVFGRLFQGKPTYIKRKHPKSGKTYGYWRHQSSATPEFGKWRVIFYPHGEKKIPTNLREILVEPLTLAVWYMDDGHFYPRDRNSFLYLGRVSKEEAKNAQDTIARNFNIHARVYDKKTKGFVLYFSVSETKKLHKLIASHMLHEFDYKLLPEMRK
tara:strand:+ start:604 stop:1212 length:609 start_codon:yes stop_codon:yes gene_type:complete